VKTNIRKVLIGFNRVKNRYDEFQWFNLPDNPFYDSEIRDRSSKVAQCLEAALWLERRTSRCASIHFWLVVGSTVTPLCF